MQASNQDDQQLKDRRIRDRNRMLWVVLVVPFIVLSVLNVIFRTGDVSGEHPTMHRSTLESSVSATTAFARPWAASADSWRPMIQAMEIHRTSPGQDLYEDVFYSGVRFQYPPMSLLLMEPLEFLSLLRLSVLNRLNGALFLVFVILMAWLGTKARKSVGGSCVYGPGTAAAASAVSALVFFPTVQAVELGQIQNWINVAFALACAAWTSDRRALAGAAVGLACIVKPQFGLLLLWSVARRDWRFSAGLVAVGAVVAPVALYVYGLGNHLSYLQVLQFLSRHGESFFHNNSINGILHGLSSGQDILVWSNRFPDYDPVIHFASLAWTVVMVSLMVWPRKHQSNQSVIDFASATLICVVASPIAWTHHYGVLLPFLPFLLARCQESRTDLFLLAASWLLLANYMPVLTVLAGTPWSIALANFFFGALVLLVVCVRLVALQSPSQIISSLKRLRDDRVMTPQG